MVDPRRYPPGYPDPSSQHLSVGGPGGIQIQGTSIHVSGGPGAPYGAPPPYGAAPLAQAPGSEVELARNAARRHPGLTAAITAFVGVTSFAGAAVLIGALGVSWLFLIPPALVSTGLFIVAGALFSRSRRYLPTGGLDASTERRLLDLGVQYRGRVTVTAAARALDMTLAEADAALTALARAGHVNVENDPRTGVLVYVFPEIEAGWLGPDGPDAGPRRLP
jgi:hypothetical protein